MFRTKTGNFRSVAILFSGSVIMMWLTVFSQIFVGSHTSLQRGLKLFPTLFFPSPASQKGTLRCAPVGCRGTQWPMFMTRWDVPILMWAGNATHDQALKCACLSSHCPSGSQIPSLWEVSCQSCGEVPIVGTKACKQPFRWGWSVWASDQPFSRTTPWQLKAASWKAWNQKHSINLRPESLLTLSIS